MTECFVFGISRVLRLLLQYQQILRVFKHRSVSVVFMCLDNIDWGVGRPVIRAGALVTQVTLRVTDTGGAFQEVRCSCCSCCSCGLVSSSLNKNTRRRKTLWHFTSAKQMVPNVISPRDAFIVPFKGHLALCVKLFTQEGCCSFSQGCCTKTSGGTVTPPTPPHPSCIWRRWIWINDGLTLTALRGNEQNLDQKVTYEKI